jgi:MFS family permease
VLADRVGSRRTLIATQLASVIITATLGILQFSHVLGEGWLLAGAFATGLMFTFALPAQSVIIPSLVPSEDGTKAAMAMNSVSYNAGRALAPAFGVLIATTMGFGWAFMFNALSFGIFALVLLTVRPCSALPAAVRSHVRDGFRIAWSEPKIMLLLLMVAMITFADDPVLVLGPALTHHLGRSADLSGYFLSALGAGSVLGSLLPRRKIASARRAATALAFLGVSIMAFVLAPGIWFGTAAAFTAGIAGLVAGSAAQAALLSQAGPERALRVMGMWTVAWAGSKPIASIIDGALPGLVGVRLTGVMLAFPALLPLLVLIFFPSVAKRFTRPRSPGRAAVPLCTTRETRQSRDLGQPSVPA